MFDGPEHRVYVRLAEHEGKVYLDLGDERCQAVEIDQDGWRVVDKPPVKFRRAKAMLPLPVPERGGSLTDLRRFLNLTGKDWPLVLGFLVAALRPGWPFPVLCLCGEHGSAKSTGVKVLRSLIDPNTAPVRAEPRDARDLAIAANNGWLVALDNLSYLPGWLSDALCRLSTGAGFATRTLYENDEETIFSAMRPVILNGIDEVATRPDLLDRSLLISLPPIHKEKRKTEAEFWREFNEARPRILGALLDSVAAGLLNLPAVKVDDLPRMADFGQWAVACEPALGIKEGSFLQSYRRNRDTANESALDSSPIVKYLLQLVDERTWNGTVGELLAELERPAAESELRLRVWPKTPRGLSGILRRLAPNLRQAGITVEFSDKPTERGRMVTLEKSPEQPSAPSGPSGQRRNQGFLPDGCPDDPDGCPDDPDGCRSGPSARKPQENKGVFNRDDGPDGADGRNLPYSNDRPRNRPRNARERREERRRSARTRLRDEYEPGADG